MYLRAHDQAAHKDGSEVAYAQLAHNVWDPVKQQSRAQGIHSFGRENHLDREGLARLVRSITCFLEPERALEAQSPEGMRFLQSRPMGSGWVLDLLWRRLGVGEAIVGVAGSRRARTLVERLLFCLVANGAVAPRSKLANGALAPMSKLAAA